MKNDIVNDFNEISQNALKSANELVELNTRILKQAIERQVELSNVFVEGNKKQVDLLKATQDPNELIEKQVQLAKECTETLVQATQENLALVQQSSEEYKAWLEKNAKVVNQTTKKPVPKRKSAS